MSTAPNSVNRKGISKKLPVEWPFFIGVLSGYSYRYIDFSCGIHTRNLRETTTYKTSTIQHGSRITEGMD